MSEADFFHDVNRAVSDALIHGLPNMVHHYPERPARDPFPGSPARTVEYRPSIADVEVRVFLQSWPNTLCGFDLKGGIAGQAFTAAYTTVVQCGNAACVYFGSRMAYAIDDTRKADGFWEAVYNRDMPSQREAARLWSGEIKAQ